MLQVYERAYRLYVQKMSNASELPDNFLSSGTSEIHRDCGITVPPTHFLREKPWGRGSNSPNLTSCLEKSFFAYSIGESAIFAHCLHIVAQYMGEGERERRQQKIKIIIISSSEVLE